MKGKRREGSFTGRSVLVRDKEEEKMYLDLLNHHFDAVTAEEYPDAIMNLIFREAYETVLGTYYRKQKVSKKKSQKIRDYVLNKLRRKYGRWINLTNFKIKDVDRCVFMTNFNRVYDVKGHGKLYGSPSQNICGNVFYTTHCLERFEERVPEYLYEPITKQLKKNYKADPTSADIIVALVVLSNKEFGVWKEFKYLNLDVGALVMEDLGDIFIAKTFLAPDMLNEEMRWYAPVVTKDDTFNSFADLLKHKSERIEKPDFLIDRLAEVLAPAIIEQILRGEIPEIEEEEL